MAKKTYTKKSSEKKKIRIKHDKKENKKEHKQTTNQKHSKTMEDIIPPHKQHKKEKSNTLKYQIYTNWPKHLRTIDPPPRKALSKWKNIKINLVINYHTQQDWSN